MCGLLQEERAPSLVDLNRVQFILTGHSQYAIAVSSEIFWTKSSLNAPSSKSLFTENIRKYTIIPSWASFVQAAKTESQEEARMSLRTWRVINVRRMNEWTMELMRQNCKDRGYIFQRYLVFRSYGADSQVQWSRAPIQNDQTTLWSSLQVKCFYKI